MIHSSRDYTASPLPVLAREHLPVLLALAPASPLMMPYNSMIHSSRDSLVTKNDEIDAESARESENTTRIPKQLKYD